MIRGLSGTFTETDPLRTIELELRIDGIGMWGLNQISAFEYGSSRSVQLRPPWCLAHPAIIRRLSPKAELTDRIVLLYGIFAGALDGSCR